jgi:hypothetical protein
MAQHFAAPTLHINSLDNTFSILEMKPFAIKTQLHFASSYERNISSFLHKLLPHHQHLVCGFH